MSVDWTEISKMSVSTGCLYFCKYVFLALIMWFVYYMAKAVMASLVQTSNTVRSKHRRMDIERDIDESDSYSMASNDSISFDKTVTKGNLGLGLKKKSSAENVMDDIVSSDSPTSESLRSVVNEYGYIDILEGVDTPVKRIPIEETVTFGRAKDCTVRVRGAFTSLHHARIIPNVDGVILRDDGSRNGTYIGDRRLTKAVVLKDGDTFSVGDAIFRYHRR